MAVQAKAPDHYFALKVVGSNPSRSMTFFPLFSIHFSIFLLIFTLSMFLNNFATISDFLFKYTNKQPIVQCCSFFVMEQRKEIKENRKKSDILPTHFCMTRIVFFLDQHCSSTNFETEILILNIICKYLTLEAYFFSLQFMKHNFQMEYLAN